MKQILPILLSLLALSNCAYLGKNKNGIDVWTIQLDETPELRFSETSNHYKQYVYRTLDDYLSFVPEFLIDIIDWIGGAIQWVQPEYSAEVVGMANALGLEPSAMFFVQYINEFSAFCTSTVAKMANGTIIHDRNLDFAFADTMRNLTFEAKFMKGDKHVFDATMFAGINGVFTGIKKGAFSISLNNRKPSWRQNPIGLLLNIKGIFTGSQQVSKLIRDTLIECDDYDCAYKKLTETPIICPGYLTIAGTKDYEGAVITRDRNHVANIEKLSKDQWFLVQTNDDHWTGVCTARCEAANNRIAAIGQENITAEGLRSVLEQYPNLNLHGIYNTIMVPALNVFDNELMYSDAPDPDFHTYFTKEKKQELELLQ